MIIETQALSRARTQRADESLTSNICGRKMSPKTHGFLFLVIAILIPHEGKGGMAISVFNMSRYYLRDGSHLRIFLIAE